MSPIDNSNIDFGYKIVKREEKQKSIVYSYRSVCNENTSIILLKTR